VGSPRVCHGFVTGEGRDRHGRVTDKGRDRHGRRTERDGGARRGTEATGGSRGCAGSVTDDRPRHEDAGNSTLPCVFFGRHDHATNIVAPMGATKDPTRPGPPSPVRKGAEGARKCDVPGIFVTDPPSELRGHIWPLSSEGPTRWSGEWADRTPGHGRGGARQGHGSPTSSRTCGGCFTDPSRPGRLIAGTARQDRQEKPRTQHGRPHRPRTTGAATWLRLATRRSSWRSAIGQDHRAGSSSGARSVGAHPQGETIAISHRSSRKARTTFATVAWS
jgi:hypothetical protein